jgi:hypothetical protein
MKVQLTTNLGTRDYPSIVEEQEKFMEGAIVDCASDLAKAIVGRKHGVLIADPEPVPAIADEPKSDKFTEMRAKK